MRGGMGLVTPTDQINSLGIRTHRQSFRSKQHLLTLFAQTETMDESAFPPPPPPFVQAAPLGKGVQRGARDVRVTDHDTENPAKSNAPDATSLPPTYMDIHVTYGM